MKKHKYPQLPRQGKRQELRAPMEANSKTVTIRFGVVGVEEIRLYPALVAVQDAFRAQGKTGG